MVAALKSENSPERAASQVRPLMVLGLELNHPNLQQPDDFKMQKLMLLLAQTKGFMFTFQRTMNSEVLCSEVVFMGNVKNLQLNQYALITTEFSRNDSTCTLFNWCTEKPFARLLKKKKNLWTVKDCENEGQKELSTIIKKRDRDILTLSYNQPKRAGFSLQFRRPKTSRIFFACRSSHSRPGLTDLSISTDLASCKLTETTGKNTRPKETVQVKVEHCNMTGADLSGLICLLQVMTLELNRY